MDVGEQHLLIDGELVPASNGEVYENLNPATEEVMGTVPNATREDVERATLAARRAFDDGRWAEDPAFRADCIGQLQQQLRKDIDVIRSAHTAEAGMPIALGYAIGVDGPIENLGYYADMIGSFDFERSLPTKEILGGVSHRIVRKEPAGVVSAITPWNFPFQLNLTKIGAALAAGCTVVLKPAPDTPWSGTMLAAAAARTDLPAGVLNILTTNDNSVAELMTTHAAVDQVTFTGSTATGRRIMRNAADTIKRVSLELGGKSAAILLEDADFATAVGHAAGVVCTHAGQGCALQTRLLVPNSRMAEAAEIAAAAYQQIPYGDPTDINNLMGPLVNKTQYEKVLGYMASGASVARLVTGGGAATQFEKGYFVQPTVFADVPADAAIAQEEIFGPVLSIVGYDSEDDVVAMANDSIYGLSGSVYSADTERAIAVAKRLRTGTVAVNMAQWYDAESPFGGYKQSGLGREWGLEGLEDFLETKTVSFPAG